MTGEITSDAQLVAAGRYLAPNPVEAGSSWIRSTGLGAARAHAGLEEPRIPLVESDLRSAFGDGDDWRARYGAQIRSTGDGASLPTADLCSTPCRTTWQTA